MKKAFKPSFRLVLAVWTFLLAGVVLLAFLWAAYYLVRQQKDELLNTQIKAFANRLPANPSGRGGVLRLEQSREWIFGSMAVHLQIHNAAGELIFQSPDWPDNLPALPEPAVGVIRLESILQSDDGQRGRGPSSGYGRYLASEGEWLFDTFAGEVHRWRLGRLQTSEAEYRILISLAKLDADMQLLLNRLLTIFTLAMLILLMGAWLIAARALRPLRNIAQAAEKIVQGSFSERIIPAEKAPEIDRIIMLLNQMLDHLEGSYRQALRFSADASHELKTPLTLMQNSLHAHLESVPAESAEAVFCVEMLEHLSRLKRVTKGLLLLAKVDARQLPKQIESFDIAELCRDLCEDAKGLIPDEEADAEFFVELPESLKIDSDPVLIRTIIFNLLVNAVRYGEHPLKIKVHLSGMNGSLCLSIVNKAAPIPEAEQGLLFERFYRGSNHHARAESDDGGSGLGLAIARELARSLGGDVQFCDADNGWVHFEFRVATSQATT
jgi:two-component system heavy metal sensor histidine kinase CusS